MHSACMLRHSSTQDMAAAADHASHRLASDWLKQAHLLLLPAAWWTLKVRQHKLLASILGPAADISSAEHGRQPQPACSILSPERLDPKTCILCRCRSSSYSMTWP